MASFGVADGLAIASDVAGMGFAHWQGNINRRFQERMADKAYEQQKEAADTKWQRDQAASMYDKHWNSIGQQKIRAIAAGMNPVDVNMAAAPSTAVPVAPDNSAAAAAPYEQLMASNSAMALRPSDIMGNFLDVGKTALQYSLDKRRTDNDTLRAIAQTTGDNLDNYIKSEAMQEIISHYKIENDSTIQTIKESQARIRQLSSSEDLNRQQIKILTIEQDLAQRTLESKVAMAKWDTEYAEFRAREQYRKATDVIDKEMAKIEQDIRESVSRVSLNKAQTQKAWKECEQIQAYIPVIHENEQQLHFENSITEETYDELVDKVKNEAHITEEEARYVVAQKWSNIALGAVRDLGIGLGAGLGGVANMGARKAAAKAQAEVAAKAVGGAPANLSFF